jgi:hypothetical protein
MIPVPSDGTVTVPEDVTDDGTSSDDGDSYDAGDTTGLGGSMGDDPVHERNEAADTFADEDTAPPSSTTGLGGSMGDDPVSWRNTPAEVEDPEDDQDGLGVGYTGLPSDPEEGVADAVEDASQNNPYVEDTTAEEWQDHQDANNPWSDVGDDVASGVGDVLDNAADTVDDATNGPVLPENLGVDVPWALVGVAGAVLALVLLRPYAGLADSATS